MTKPLSPNPIALLFMSIDEACQVKWNKGSVEKESITKVWPGLGEWKGHHPLVELHDELIDARNYLLRDLCNEMGWTTHLDHPDPREWPAFHRYQHNYIVDLINAVRDEVRERKVVG
jgi:LmbE family N-acetylglucosaminyl deacetylase